VQAMDILILSYPVYAKIKSRKNIANFKQTTIVAGVNPRSNFMHCKVEYVWVWKSNFNWR